MINIIILNELLNLSQFILFYSINFNMEKYFQQYINIWKLLFEILNKKNYYIYIVIQIEYYLNII